MIFLKKTENIIKIRFFLIFILLAILIPSCSKKIKYNFTPREFEIDTVTRSLVLNKKWISASIRIERLKKKNFFHYYLLGFTYEKQRKSKKALLAYLKATKELPKKAPSRIANNPILKYIKNGKPSVLFPFAAYKVAKIMQPFGLNYGSDMVIRLINENKYLFLKKKILELKIGNYFKQKKWNVALQILNNLLSKGNLFPYFKMGLIYTKMKNYDKAFACYRSILLKSHIPWQRAISARQILSLDKEKRLSRKLSQKNLFDIAEAFISSKRKIEAKVVLKRVWPDFKKIDISKIEKANLVSFLNIFTQLESNSDSFQLKKKNYPKLLNAVRDEDKIEAYNKFYELSFGLYRERKYKKAEFFQSLLLKDLEKYLKKFKGKNKDEINRKLAVHFYKTRALGGIISAIGNKTEKTKKSFLKIITMARQTKIPIPTDNFELLTWKLVQKELSALDYKNAARWLGKFTKQANQAHSPRLLYWKFRTRKNNNSFSDFLSNYYKTLFAGSENFYSVLSLIAGKSDFPAMFSILEDLLKKKNSKFLQKIYNIKSVADSRGKVLLDIFFSQYRAVLQSGFMSKKFLNSFHDNKKQTREKYNFNNDFNDNFKILIKNFELGIGSYKEKKILNAENINKNINDFASWIINDPVVYFTKIFWQMGMVKDAIKILKFHKAQNPGKYYISLISLSRRFKDPYLGLKYTQEYLEQPELRNQNLFSFPGMIKKSLFPTPHKKPVLDSAKKYKIDPFLIWAIMRAESSFRENITSPAGAVGLMQLLPLTGHKIARELGFSPPNLTNPRIAIFTAGKLIHLLSGRFSDNIVWITAGYNAGPLKAFEWLRKSRKMPTDIAIETITFGETKRFVQKVMYNYTAYKGIYGKAIKE